MATEPTYTADDNMVFLGRAVPQSLGAGVFPSGGSDTFATARGLLYIAPNPPATTTEIIWGPFPANVGFDFPNEQRRISVTETVEATPTLIASGGRNFFIIGWTTNSVGSLSGDTIDYYISFGTYAGGGGGLDPATLNTLPVSDEFISSTVIGTTFTFEHGSVTLTSASVRGPVTGLGDFIGTYSTTIPPFDPGNITDITPA